MTVHVHLFPFRDRKIQAPYSQQKQQAQGNATTSEPEPVTDGLVPKPLAPLGTILLRTGEAYRARCPLHQS